MKRIIINILDDYCDMQNDDCSKCRLFDIENPYCKMPKIKKYLSLDIFDKYFNGE